MAIVPEKLRNLNRSACKAVLMICLTTQRYLLIGHMLYLHSFCFSGQTPRYLSQASMRAINCKAGARTGPWTPGKFSHLMVWRSQDATNDMSIANNHIVTTVGCCGHKNHHNTARRHSHDVSRYTTSSEVTGPNSEKLALIRRQPLGSHSKASYVVFLPRPLTSLSDSHDSVSLR
jgi:hypothetical protein